MEAIRWRACVNIFRAAVLGLVLVSLGIAFAAGSLPMFVVPLAVFATANFVHIPFEEAKMRRQFGPSFDDYTRRVRRWV